MIDCLMLLKYILGLLVFHLLSTLERNLLDLDGGHLFDSMQVADFLEDADVAPLRFDLALLNEEQNV